MNKKILILIIVLVVAGAGFYLYNKQEAQPPALESPQPDSQNGQSYQATTTDSLASSTGPSTATNIKGNTGPDYTPGQYSSGDEGEAGSPNIQVVEVDFDGTKFSPSTVNIHQNDYVFFKNVSTIDVWPASNPHPTHTDYPGFDAKKNIPPGGEYKFQFTKIGNWGYHDHLDHSITGTVNVTK